MARNASAAVLLSPEGKLGVPTPGELVVEPSQTTTYALVAWILIEAGSVLLPTFGVPEWFFRVYVLIILGGFVVSLVLAWVFEVTPDGVKLDSEVDRKAQPKRDRSRSNVVIIALLAVALGVSITFNVTGIRSQHEEALATGTVMDSIAVLPFTSRSTDPDNQFFADGIHDDLLTRLAGIESLRVVDSSIFPTIPNGNLNSPTIMTAERAADIPVVLFEPEFAVRRAGYPVDLQFKDRVAVSRTIGFPQFPSVSE